MQQHFKTEAALQHFSFLRTVCCQPTEIKKTGPGVIKSWMSGRKIENLIKPCQQLQLIMNIPIEQPIIHYVLNNMPKYTSLHIIAAWHSINVHRANFFSSDFFVLVISHKIWLLNKISTLRNCTLQYKIPEMFVLFIFLKSIDCPPVATVSVDKLSFA